MYCCTYVDTCGAKIDDVNVGTSRPAGGITIQCHEYNNGKE